MQSSRYFSVLAVIFSPRIFRGDAICTRSDRAPLKEKRRARYSQDFAHFLSILLFALTFNVAVRVILGENVHALCTHGLHKVFQWHGLVLHNQSEGSNVFKESMEDKRRVRIPVFP